MTEFIAPTGKLIKEYLDAYSISQKDFSTRTGISEKHISNMLNGKTALTEDMALKLEKIMPDVSAGYWLNYEAKYREHLAREKEQCELAASDLDNIAKRFHFNELFSDSKMNRTEKAVEVLKLLQISSFERFDFAYADLPIDFMEDGGEKEAIVLWLKLCEEEAPFQNDENIDEVVFNPKKLKEELSILKAIADNENIDVSIRNCRMLLNEVGVYLVEQEAIRNCKVRGALATYNNHPSVFISRRFRKHDHVWFTIVHEIAHLLLHYDSKHTIISMEDPVEGDEREKEANTFARDFFIDNDEYESFVSIRDFSESAVRQFALSQKVVPGLVVGFLQHDKYIKFSELSYLKS